MYYEKIHIDEEKNTLIWGLAAAVAMALAAFLLIDVFFVDEISLVELILSLILIGIAGYGIMISTAPKYHFDLFIREEVLVIEISHSDEPPFDKQKIPLSEISRLRIAPHTPRSRNDALFDFSTNYYLLYQAGNGGEYKRLIYPEGKLFTFKVEDIRKIIGFLAANNENIFIPPDHELFMK